MLSTNPSLSIFYKHTITYPEIYNFEDKALTLLLHFHISVYNYYTQVSKQT